MNSHCGLIFIRSGDPISRFMRAITKQDYTNIGFYCDSSCFGANKTYVILTDMFGTTLPCPDQQVTLDQILDNPLNEEVAIKELVDTSRVLDFRRAIADATARCTPPSVRDSVHATIGHPPVDNQRRTAIDMVNEVISNMNAKTEPSRPHASLNALNSLKHQKVTPDTEGRYQILELIGGLFNSRWDNPSIMTYLLPSPIFGPLRKLDLPPRDPAMVEQAKREALQKYRASFNRFASVMADEAIQNPEFFKSTIDGINEGLGRDMQVRGLVRQGNLPHNGTTYSTNIPHNGSAYPVATNGLTNLPHNGPAYSGINLPHNRSVDPIQPAMSQQANSGVQSTAGSYANLGVANGRSAINRLDDPIRKTTGAAGVNPTMSDTDACTNDIRNLVTAGVNINAMLVDAICKGNSLDYCAFIHANNQLTTAFSTASKCVGATNIPLPSIQRPQFRDEPQLSLINTSACEPITGYPSCDGDRLGLSPGVRQPIKVNNSCADLNRKLIGSCVDINNLLVSAFCTGTPIDYCRFVAANTVLVQSYYDGRDAGCPIGTIPPKVPVRNPIRTTITITNLTNCPIVMGTQCGLTNNNPGDNGSTNNALQNLTNMHQQIVNGRRPTLDVNQLIEYINKTSQTNLPLVPGETVMPIDGIITNAR